MQAIDKTIQNHLKPQNPTSPEERHLQETIRKAKSAFHSQEAAGFLTRAEFLFWQSRYIRKRWWALQGGLLLLLWILLKQAGGSVYIHKTLGAAAPLFVLLLLPELWKNRRTGAMEVECAAWYSLRQVYAARIFLCALVDFLLLGLFTSAVLLTGKLCLEELLIQFFLPYLVACCICFHTLYSPRIQSEAFACFLCMAWCALWTRLALHEKIYDAVSRPAWLAMTAAALFYLGYCIIRGQRRCVRIWEGKTQWN